MFGRQGEIISHRSAASRQDHERDALFAAAERKELAAQKFEEWVRFKDSFDRGLALFAKLDPGHCEVSEPHRWNLALLVTGRTQNLVEITHRNMFTRERTLRLHSAPIIVMKDIMMRSVLPHLHIYFVCCCYGCCACE